METRPKEMFALAIERAGIFETSVKLPAANLGPQPSASYYDIRQVSQDVGWAAIIGSPKRPAPSVPPWSKFSITGFEPIRENAAQDLSRETQRGENAGAIRFGIDRRPKRRDQFRDSKALRLAAPLRLPSRTGGRGAIMGCTKRTIAQSQRQAVGCDGRRSSR